ncbi:energy transducer TonB [Taklimakanibacter lacteus]|uniref:energy transducer TonB n=1 Tax=Taklimakanibacter lacteus TaxID=2268456 RepID=UPI0013C49E5D
MRRSLTISLLAHAAILACAFIVLPNPEEFKVEEQESIPIDIVSIEDLGKRQATVKTPEKPVEKAAPKPVEQVQSVKPAPEVAPEVKTAAKEVSAPPPEPKPEVKEEPKKEEPKPEPKPEELAELIKKTDEPEPEKKKEEPKKAEVKPEKKPVEKQPEKKPDKKAKPKKEFNLDDISAFLNKTDEKRTAPLKQQAEAGTPKQGEFNLSGLDDGVAATLKDALQQHLYKCWDVPPGAREAEIQVKVHFFLNPDGTVSGAPEVVNGRSDPLFAATAQSALSAVMSCQAYTFLPQDKYDMWREITFTFNPNLMS